MGQHGGGEREGHGGGACTSITSSRQAGGSMGQGRGEHEGRGGGGVEGTCEWGGGGRAW